MGIDIRLADPGDRAACIALLGMLSEATGGAMSAAAESVFDQLIDGSRGAVLVADEAGELLGLASLSFNVAMRYGGEYCQLEELVVSPEARGKNIGALLMTQAVQTARARGCAEFGLYLVETTEHNRGFYEKFGFAAVGTEMRQPL